VLFVLCPVLWGWCAAETITKELIIPAFDKILINHGYVPFHQSGENRVIVSVDADLERNVLIAVNNGVLVIGMTDLPTVAFEVFTIDVYGHTADVAIKTGVFEAPEKIAAPSFNADISGNGTLRVNLECDDVFIKTAGIGTIEGHIDCNDFIAEIAGGGFIKIDGTCKTAHISFETPGRYGTFGSLDSVNFITDDTTISIDGPVKANISSVRTLNAAVSGDGRINYRGDPQTNISGNPGNVKKAG
jgi:hypothetical protein